MYDTNGLFCPLTFRTAIIGLFKQIHRAGLIHGDVDTRHICQRFPLDQSPKSKVPKFALIDFDRAIFGASDTLIQDEQSKVCGTLEVSRDIW